MGTRSRGSSGVEGDFAADLEKYRRICFAGAEVSRRAMLRLFLMHFGLQCVAVYRFHRWVCRLRATHRLGFVLLRPLSLFLNQAMAFVHKVHLGAEIGPGLFIGHVGNIYVGARRIGRNFSITHNVTLGRGPGHEGQGMPTVGDDVWIGTGCVISGEIHLGDGATIASGTVLSRSVPAGAFVAGNPGRVARLHYDNAPLLGLPPADPGAPPGPPVADPIVAARA